MRSRPQHGDQGSYRGKDELRARSRGNRGRRGRQCRLHEPGKGGHVAEIGRDFDEAANQREDREHDQRDGDAPAGRAGGFEPDRTEEHHKDGAEDIDCCQQGADQPGRP